MFWWANVILCLMSDLWIEPMAPEFVLIWVLWGGLCYSITYISRQQTKQEDSEIFKALLITPPPPSPPQMQATKKLIQEAEAQIVGFALYNSTNIVFYIIFSWNIQIWYNTIYFNKMPTNIVQQKWT